MRTYNLSTLNSDLNGRVSAGTLALIQFSISIRKTDGSVTSLRWQASIIHRLFFSILKVILKPRGFAKLLLPCTAGHGIFLWWDDKLSYFHFPAAPSCQQEIQIGVIGRYIFYNLMWECLWRAEWCFFAKCFKKSFCERLPSCDCTKAGVARNNYWTAFDTQQISFHSINRHSRTLWWFHAAFHFKSINIKDPRLRFPPVFPPAVGPVHTPALPPAYTLRLWTVKE